MYEICVALTGRYYNNNEKKNTDNGNDKQHSKVNDANGLWIAEKKKFIIKFKGRLLDK